MRWKRAFKDMVALGFGLALLAAWPAVVTAGSNEAADRDATAALNRLYKNVKGARSLGQRAVGILMFPTVGKGGIGVLRRGGRSVGYFRRRRGTAGYALFLMSNTAMRRIENGQELAVGSLPGLRQLKPGDRTLRGKADGKQIYVISFDRLGQLSEANLGGQKFSRLRPK